MANNPTGTSQAALATTVGQNTAEIGKIQSKVETISTAVQRHSAYFLAAVIVAAVFGISGAFGWRLLQNAKAEIDLLTGQVDSLSTTISEYEATIAELVESSKSELRAEADAILETIPQSVDGEITRQLDQYVRFDSKIKLHTGNGGGYLTGNRLTSDNPEDPTLGDGTSEHAEWIVSKITSN